MKRSTLQYLTLAAAVAIPLTSIADNSVEPADVTEAKSIVKQFAGSLKPQLMQAMKEGGAEHAITVCADKAPKIAEQLSLETGWKIQRVSLKARNPNAHPDAWEKQVLEAFDQRAKAGEKPMDMAHAEVVNGQFRFMKAQGVAPLCMNCHGDQVAGNVQKAIQQHYPNDQATGYTPGQIRGAISLTKPAN